MRPRTSALGFVLIVAAAAAVALPAQAARPTDQATLLKIGGPAIRRSIPPGFLGLSLEYWAVPAYAGPNPHRVNPVFLQLIRNLTGDSAPVLRIGGVTSDNTWRPTKGVRRPAGVVFALTRRWIRIIGAVAAKLDARLIAGINLEADSARVAAAEASAVVAGVGRERVQALELGNEPELYSTFTWGISGAPGRPAGWDFSAFDRDFARIGDALPDLPLAGPVVGQTNWFRYTKRFLSDQRRVAIVTLHRYPLQLCYLSPGQLHYPSIPHLLAAANSRGLAESVAAAVRTAHARHVALRIDEINTISCGDDPAVAQSFASALWSLDVLFEMARVGVDGVNIHTFPGATYQLFAFTHDHGRWRAVVEPDYYGLAMFAQAAPAGARLLKVSPAARGQLKVWATRARDGVIRVVAINEGAVAHTIALRAPAGVLGRGTLERLEAPGIGATGQVTLAGQTFGAATGLPTGRRRTSLVTPRDGRYVVRVPAASAAMLTLS
ncbi:MAG: glycosyl hydrolase family 79 C-terminal domain-containing protein [Solirubrobacteraceae bacterium]